MDAIGQSLVLGMSFGVKIWFEFEPSVCRCADCQTDLENKNALHVLLCTSLSLHGLNFCEMSSQQLLQGHCKSVDKFMKGNKGIFDWQILLIGSQQ